MTLSEYPDFSHIANAPKSFDLSALTDLARRLQAVDYSYEGVEKLVGAGAFAAMARDQVVPARLRVKALCSGEGGRAQQKLAVTVALFMLGEKISEPHIDRALGAGATVLLESLGLIESCAQVSTVSGAEAAPPIFCASVDMSPHQADDGTEMWVASDPGAHQRPGALRKDHVLGIGQASLNLAQFIERQQVERALDIGTGCGIQTFHLLAHAQQVTATDISPRALAFTRFNLLLNAPVLGIDPQNLQERVSLRLGSLLEPVVGEKFDLVVSNPPFVITPRRSREDLSSRYTYRDGGLAGDSIVSQLVQHIPEVLVAGGRAQLLGNWEIPYAGSESEQGSVEWSARLRDWVGQTSEAWFIQREVVSPEQYAETWLRDSSEGRDPASYAAAYSDYVQDFERRGVGAIGLGMVWLRAPVPAGLPPLQRFEEITHPIQQPIAPFITEAVAAHDTLIPLTDAELAKVHLVVADDVMEERHARPGADHPGVIVLRQGAGLRRSLVESTATAGFVSACDGELAVGQIVNALETLLGWSGESAESEKLALFGHIRELIKQGFFTF